MTQRVVLYLHSLRGALWSPQRIADLRAARAAMENLRTRPEYRDAIIVAPYLLYGEVSHDPAALRIRGGGGVPPGAPQ